MSVMLSIRSRFVRANQPSSMSGIRILNSWGGSLVSRNGISFLFAFALLVTSLVGANSAKTAENPDVKAVLDTYANIAEAGYTDSVTTAHRLKEAIDDLLKEPTPESLATARAAWIAARVPYQQTEAFRFGNLIVDDWEGRVNSWPLDEGLIDYVETEFYGTENFENDLYVANVIANKSLKIGGTDVDTSKITKELLRDKLQEAGGVEANVATGYHAIEFLLWGQDLNGTEAGAGDRPATDYDLKNCTNGNCDRRAEYLRVVTDLLIEDLDWMAKQWAKGGAARAALTETDEKKGLLSLFIGLGSLSYGELAGERMKLGLLIHDPEEEHDCFSDNTHNSHYYDVIGIRNVYLASYKRTDGSTVSGPSASDLIRAAAPEIDERVRAAIENTVAKMTELKKRGDTIERYDQMIGQGNTEGNAVVQAAIDALIAQARELERAMAVLKLEAAKFEGSDSLDNPSSVK
ncbi:Peptidase [Candidatus Filomicrobium marinum]|uniref:Peptidase n=1 Tax=Candidatus Filomicrobium marinum TaxID=1608628 RepID=A0A0D6JFE2_9HYPH|nr:Peptidase [Candidatus Filomicrobium marinum]CPR19376.1 Peptidase [Candidatus Filomicrobium marinum]